MNDNASETAVNRVECRASKDSAVRLFIGAVALVGLGVWCFVEAYILKKYPAPEAWNIENVNPAASYALNHFGPFLFIPLGILLAVLAFRTLRRFVVADGEGIVVNGRPKVAWDKFTGIDASLLESKGLLTLKRTDGPGVRLDRYHYRDFRDLVAFIEDRVKVEG